MNRFSNERGSTLVIVVLVIIIVALVLVMIVGRPRVKDGYVSNKAVAVLDDVNFKEYEDDELLVLKVQNKSSKAIVNKTPILIYYDENNMPIHEGWGAKVSYFAPNDIRFIEFYDTIKEFSKVELGFYDREDKNQYTDLRDKVTYTVEKADKANEDGIIELRFKGENKADKDVAVEFQVAYYAKNKLIYEDGFITVIDSNSSFDTYEEYHTKYFDGKEFPEGYKYEVTLAEAVEYIDNSPLEDEPEDVQDSFDWAVLSNEEKIEHAIHQLLKKTYGDKLEAAKIYVDKMYTKEEVEKNEVLKTLNIKDTDIAFEASMSLQPAEGADINQFTVADGVYDKDSGWVGDVHRLGILRYDAEAKTYSIDNYGTGW